AVGYRRRSTPSGVPLAAATVIAAKAGAAGSDGINSSGYIFLVAPPNHIQGRVTQPLFNPALRRHRAITEYVQSPLSRQWAGSVAGCEEVRVRQPEAAYTRMGGGGSTNPVVNGGRRGVGLPSSASSPAPVQRWRLGSSMSGVQGPQQISWQVPTAAMAAAAVSSPPPPLHLQPHQDEDNTLVRWRSADLDLEQRLVVVAAAARRNKPTRSQPSEAATATAAAAARTALALTIGGHSSGTPSSGSVRIRVLQATVDGTIHAAPSVTAAALAAARRSSQRNSRRSSSTYSDPGGGYSGHNPHTFSDSPGLLGLPPLSLGTATATGVRETSTHGSGPFSAFAVQVPQGSSLMRDVDPAAVIALRAGGPSFPIGGGGGGSPMARRPSNPSELPSPRPPSPPPINPLGLLTAVGSANSAADGNGLVHPDAMSTHSTSAAAVPTATATSGPPSSSGMMPRRWPPVRSATPPPRMPTHNPSVYLRGSTSGYGIVHGGPGGGHNHFGVYGSSISGCPMSQQDSSRVWGGLEALMEAYTHAGRVRGAAAGRAAVPLTVGATPRTHGSINLSSGPAAGDSAVAGATGTLFDSRALPDVRSSDSRGGVMVMYDSAVLQGMIEVAQGSNGNGNGNRDFGSSTLPFLPSSREGRDSNTSRLMTVLGTALRSKRISKGGASLGALVSVGESVGNAANVSKRFSVLSGGRESASTARGEGIASGCSASPATFMEAMLQLATGAATAHQLAVGGSSITGLHRTVSPLSMLGGGGSNGGGGGGSRNTQPLPRLAALTGRDSEGSQAAGSYAGTAGSHSGLQQQCLQPQPQSHQPWSGGSLTGRRGGGGGAAAGASPDGGSPPGETLTYSQYSLTHLRAQAAGAVKSGAGAAVSMYGTSSSWTAQASQAPQPVIRFPSYLYEFSRAESFGTNTGNDSSDSAATPPCAPLMSTVPHMSPSAPPSGHARGPLGGIDGGRGSVGVGGGGGSSNTPLSGGGTKKLLYDMRSARIPSVHYVDGSSVTSVLQGVGGGGGGGGWPLSRSPSTQRYVAIGNGPRQSYDASQVSGEFPPRIAASGSLTRPSPGPLAPAVVYGIMRTGSGIDRVAASVATPSHSEILPAALRMRAELTDGPTDSFRTVGYDPSVHLPALGLKLSAVTWGHDRPSIRVSPPSATTVVSTSNSVTASLRPYMGHAQNLCTAGMPLMVSIRAAGHRSSSKGEPPSGQGTSFTGALVASRVSSQRERSFAGGSLTEQEPVMVSGLQEALGSNVEPQGEVPPGCKLLSSDGNALPVGTHVSRAHGVSAIEIEPLSSVTSGAGAGAAGIGPAAAGSAVTSMGAAHTLTAPIHALSAVHEAATYGGGDSVWGGGFGGAGAASGKAVSSSGRSGRRRPVSRNPTPERLVAGLTRRLDSLISPGADMPQWDAAAREGLRSRQASGAASLVGRLGAGVVHRIAPGSKKAMVQQQSASLLDGTLCFRGFRVRCGMHSGLEEGRDLHWAKVGGRRAYSGPAMALAKAVSDLVPGGMVLLTAATFERLQPWPNSEALPGAIIWARGRFRVGVGEATSAVAPLREVDLFQLLSPQLLARQPALERRPWRGAEQVLPGVLSAPLGRLALVLVQVAGVQVLRSWNLEVTFAALQVFGSVAAEMLPAWGGFPATMDLQSGTLLAAFREPALALGFMHALIDVLQDAEWPPELLTHELGEPLTVPVGAGGSCVGGVGVGGSSIPGVSTHADGVASIMPVMSMSVSGTAPSGVAAEPAGSLFRGLRIRCVADVASVRVDLGCATAAALYEARDPKAFKALRRMLAVARMGSVLCSGLLVSEVLSGPPTALAALHDLLAFAPVVTAAAPPPPPPPPLQLSPVVTPGQGSLAPSPAPSILPSPLLQPSSPRAGPSSSAPGGPPVARHSINFSAVGGGGSGMLTSGSVIPVSARLTRKEASRSTVYQCTRRRPVRRSGMGQAGFALVGSVGGVYGAAAGMYGSSLFGAAAGSMNSGVGVGGVGVNSVLHGVSSLVGETAPVEAQEA
ncbi:hypothetical protein Vafri_9128, partial [Volvox africanus]